MTGEQAADGERTRGARVMRRVDELARFTAEPGKLTRLYLTSEHKAAASQVQAWMTQAGMTARLDAVGNVVGRYDGAMPEAPILLLGSHIDTVRDAGKYDGNLGVVVAIEAVAELHRRGERLPFALEVLAFGDEEGVRFPVTLTGSRAIAGTLDPKSLDAKDADGISLREALRQFGCDPDAIPSATRGKQSVLGYVEVHIEQGPVLQAESLPVGVGTAINGASRFIFNVNGMAGHAGTVPMPLRRDALAAAAEMILAIERIGRDTADLVATVGSLTVVPGAVNVIPGAARFAIDVRSPNDAVREAAVAQIEQELRLIAEGRRVGVAMTRTYDQSAATCAPWLIEQLAAAVERAGIRPRLLPSGAGHDGLAMVSLCDIAMLFVRCKDGISHHPAESVTVEDADVAVRVLLDFLRHLIPPARVTDGADGGHGR